MQEVRFRLDVSHSCAGSGNSFFMTCGLKETVALSKRGSYIISIRQSFNIGKSIICHINRTVICHFDKYNIYYFKTSIIFNFSIRWVLWSHRSAPRCLLPKWEWRHYKYLTHVTDQRPWIVTIPQLRYRSVGTFITIKIPQTSVLLYENRILVSRLYKIQRPSHLIFSYTPIQVVPHVAVVVQ